MSTGFLGNMQETTPTKIDHALLQAAFPLYVPTQQAGGNAEVIPGMTLRDYFAAHAPVTIKDATDWLNYHGGPCLEGHWRVQTVMNTLADLRNDYATAMIEARPK